LLQTDRESEAVDEHLSRRSSHLPSADTPVSSFYLLTYLLTYLSWTRI